jgi:biopolymer transport protein TolR
MAMQLGTSGGVKSEINVTPLVDVMLVLLIIMMIVAPMLQKGVDVRLPMASNSAAKPETQEQTVLAIKADKTLWVNGIQVRESDLRTRVEEAMETKKEKVVLIKADEDVEYGAVMGAMDALREGGIEDMGLITEPRVRQGAEGAPAAQGGGE